ncbi:response regulator [Geminocystis sp. NIES-3709]|uniref:response regulator n=1 Tax=Geminocystis sp. NIES-3709 TaxID=1617448 RepID=UPI0005FC564C|nr:response regulator [Geminocystis sp. NIES-3709]BAQ63306.1 signal transduction histidine kinase CheA [Geminocystis sp. NIES-3709]
MLDAASLAAIAEEARICFLEEDAPEYLDILTKGIDDLKQSFQENNDTQKLEFLYKELGRAAHSIKGGAGMAEMPVVSKLAHKVEDIFEALQQDRISDFNTTFELLSLAIDDLENLINLEKSSSISDDNSSDLLTVLDEFLATLNPQNDVVDIGFADDSFITMALNQDLSACIERVKEIVDNPSLANPKNITNSLNILLEECQLLGQALNCNWLVKLSQVIRDLQANNQDSPDNFTRKSIEEIENHKQQFLAGNKNPIFSSYFQPETTIEKSENKELESKKIDNNEILSPSANVRNLRIPLDKITNLSNIVGQLLTNYESLKLYENQLKQASVNLKKKTKSLAPVKEQIESMYDQLTISQSSFLANNIKELNHQLSEFDTLEFDEYNQVHTSLQNLTELIIQVQEVREDFDLVNREFQETLIEMQKSLNILDQELRKVRLVPFISLAGGFFKPLEKLNKTYGKSVELVVEGKDILIDQNIIEILRTPFNHLIRNAFDHGIESPEMRKKLGKSLPAIIKLTAKIEGNSVILTIKDDGGGININKVYEKALSLGLFAKNISFADLTQEEILRTIFSPGFSTASQVSDLSGRGMGMDIVKAEIEKLRGTIQVNTNIGKGTEFKLKIPLGLNIISLLLVKISKQVIAIPSENVFKVISLSNHDINDNQMLWEGKKIPVYNLSQILPYNENLAMDISQGYIGLLLNINGEEIIMRVEGIVEEKPLVAKSFDDTVAIPPYIGGGTILGNGSFVPILIPDYLTPLLTNKQVVEDDISIPKEELSVMVIDDSVTVRRSLNRVLSQVGYNVTQCRDGKEAWNTLQSTTQSFNIAICDLEMPGVDGYKFLQMVRVSEKWQHLPIIILTSRNNDLHRQKAFDLGANAYMTKPFNPLKIIDSIEELAIK